MKVALIGGSNGLTQESYSRLLSRTRGIEFNNFAIGGVTSIFGIIQMVKYDVARHHDVVIVEYYVNDCVHYHYSPDKLKPSIEMTKKVLVELVNFCSLSKTRLIFINICPACFENGDQWKNSKMRNFYNSFLKEHDITHIDALDLFREHFYDHLMEPETGLSMYPKEKNINDPGNKHWHIFYKTFDPVLPNGNIDSIHLSAFGSSILYSHLLPKLLTSRIPKYISLESSFNKPNVIQFKDVENSKNFKNSLVNVDYIQVFKNIDLIFDKETSVLAVEYLCEKDSGYIELDNKNRKISKCLLMNEFVIKNKEGKHVQTHHQSKFISNLTFRSVPSESNLLKIKLIKEPEVDRKYFEEDINHLVKIPESIADEQNNQVFNLVSIMVTNNANLLSFKIDNLKEDDGKAVEGRDEKEEKEEPLNKTNIFSFSQESIDVEAIVKKTTSFLQKSETVAAKVGRCKESDVSNKIMNHSLPL